MLLVRAATLPEGPAVDCWERWCRIAVPEEMHSGEIRLLAGAYRRLTGYGLRGSMIDVARGVYRRTWYVNQLTVPRVAAIVRHLEAAEIPVLVLKGLALAFLAYRDPGARPMEDVDLLVPPGRLHDALGVLEGEGFRSTGHEDGLLANDVEIADGDGNTYELHDFALIESADDADLWERSTTFTLHHVEAAAPCSSDMLLLVAAHGQRWNSVQPVSWVLDAHRLVTADGDAFGWDRFADRAEARALQPVAARAASMLASLGVEVPSRVVQRLEEPVPTAIAVGDRARRAAPTRLSTSVMAWDRYRRFRRTAPPEWRPAGPIDWLARSWSVEGPRSLPAEGIRRLRSLDRSIRSPTR
jgi:hypothetical protein